MNYTMTESPMGALLLVSDGEALTELYLEPAKAGVEGKEGWVRQDDAAPFPEVNQQLEEYFAGARKEFQLPLRMEGTPFQQRVWEALREIPYGETVSYGEIARRIESPRACRAVGLANGQNPIAIIVPCHRVIGSSGKLVGYGGGLHRKAALLQIEGIAV